MSSTLVRHEAAQVCHIGAQGTARGGKMKTGTDRGRGMTGTDKRETNQGEWAMKMTMDGCEVRSELEP